MVRFSALEFGEARLSYNHQRALDSDITLTLAKLGVRLRFEPSTQRLKAIDVYDVSRIVWGYDNVFFAQPPTLGEVARVLGPTFPMVRLEQTQQALIVYPGVCFVARLPAKEESRVQRVLVMHGTAKYDDLRLPAPTSREFERVEARVNEGLYFGERKECIPFGAAPQDVLSMLGTPSSRTPKTTHKTKIHNIAADNGGGAAGAVVTPGATMVDTGGGGGGVNVADAATATAADTLDYWFNYFHCGIDILFDGVTHRVKKFILHSNFPGHPEFGRYQKCNFTLRPLAAATTTTQTILSAATTAAATPLIAAPAAELRASSSATSIMPSSSSSSSSLSSASLLMAAVPGESQIRVDAQWAEVVKVMGAPGQHLVHVIKGPFEASRSYSYDGVIFEVMGNDHLASITIM